MMTRPEALSKNEPLLWSTGNGTDAWEMFYAARKGDLPRIKSLLEKDPTLVRSEFDYRNTISFAVRENRPEIVAFLLEKGAGPVHSGTEDTLLQIAKDRGFLQVQHLLEEAIGSLAGTLAGELIAEKIRRKDFEQVKFLLQTNPELLFERDQRTNQPIHWAVMTRQPEMINLLLDMGADINARRADGARPIQLTNGDYHFRGWRDVPTETKASPNDIYRILIERGAYLDICMASLKGNTECVKELLREDPSLANKPSDYISYYPGSGTPLKNACLGGHIEIVKLLLKHGADPNLPEEGIAPHGHALHSAVCNGHIEIVRLLLEHGAYPSVEIESSADTLSAAIDRGNQAMVELLCSYGASRPVSLLAYYGDIQTAAAVFAANPGMANDPYALECAASQGHSAFVRLMLRYEPELASKIAVGVRSQGPDDSVRSIELAEYLFRKGMNPNHRNWLGLTPLHRFAKKNDIINLKLFIQHGADLNTIDEEFYSTPLGYAAKYGSMEAAEYLLENGADPNLPETPNWAKPLAWARKRNHRNVVELLVKYGAKE